MMKEPSLILVDGSSYFFRAFHALPPLTNSKGYPTGAIYGVANMIKRLFKDYPHSPVAVIFDAPGKTFRDELYPLYKAQRKTTPVDLSQQFDPMIGLLEAMGLPIIIIEGVEADDVIGTLALKAESRGQSLLISTGDKDLAQLVTENVCLINTMNNHFLDRAGVKEKFGVYPEQIVDFLTLVGDSVDNIPGVMKCGPKTAAKWLNHYGNLDRLIEDAEAISGKIGEYLRQSLPYLGLSKQLVQIKTDVFLPMDFKDLHLKTPNQERLLALVKELEFKSWLKELLTEFPKEDPGSSCDLQKNYSIVSNEKGLNLWLEKLNHAQTFCLDTETTSLDIIEAEIVGVSLCIDEGEAAYFPFTHQEASPQLNREETLNRLKPYFEDPSKKKIGQNLKYDYAVLKNHGITLKGIAFDSMLESYILNSTAGRHDMDTLALKYLGYKTISFEELAGKGAKQKRFDEISLEAAAHYAAEDADITLKLHHKLYPKLEPCLQKVLEEIEIPLVSILAEMERGGVLIDPAVLMEHGQRLKKRLHSLEEEAYTLAGKSFNLNSPKQLQGILFEDLQLPILEKTATGQASTAEAILQELAMDYPFPAVILEYRSLSKLVSTYIDALPKRINHKTGRVHTSYNQAVTATGRLSSSDPNLQNIPIRHEEGRLIRKAFIAPPGHVLLAADYSQIELRIMAHLSQDQALLQAFSDNLDIHSATASEIFQVALEKVSADQRRHAKAINFGLIYGMSSFGLAKQLGIKRDEAQAYIDVYFQRYPGVLAYMENTREQARQLGFVETVFGRRLYLPEINSPNQMKRRAAERTAINAPMQGTAADLIKRAMIRIHAWQEEQGLAKMIMQVHDELVFEIKEADLPEARTIIQEMMEKDSSLSVPLRVSLGIGLNWDEAH